MFETFKFIGLVVFVLWTFVLWARCRSLSSELKSWEEANARFQAKSEALREKNAEFRQHVWSSIRHYPNDLQNLVHSWGTKPTEFAKAALKAFLEARSSISKLEERDRRWQAEAANLRLELRTKELAILEQISTETLEASFRALRHKIPESEA